MSATDRSSRSRRTKVRHAVDLVLFLIIAGVIGGLLFGACAVAIVYGLGLA